MISLHKVYAYLFLKGEIWGKYELAAENIYRVAISATSSPRKPWEVCLLSRVSSDVAVNFCSLLHRYFHLKRPSSITTKHI